MWIDVYIGSDHLHRFAASLVMDMYTPTFTDRKLYGRKNSLKDRYEMRERFMAVFIIAVQRQLHANRIIHYQLYLIFPSRINPPETDQYEEA